MSILVGMLLALPGLVPPARGADVLIPEATPKELDDFSIAFMMYDLVVTAARDGGVDLEDAEQIRAWAGPVADGCWDNAACPASLWARTDARLVVVMSVGQSPGGVHVAVRLHGADEKAPFKLLDEVVPPGGEGDYAAVVARAIRDALPLLEDRARAPEDPDERDPDERDPDERDPDERDPDERDLEGLDEPERPPRRALDEPDRPPRRAALVGDDEAERLEMRIPRRAFSRYRESGLDRAAWLAKARVRSGRAYLELAAGWGLGDVDRGYGVRLRLDESAEGVFSPGASSTWEGEGGGSGMNGWIAVGYAPTWFLDTSVGVGVQYGKKHLDAGWECASGACDPASWENVYDPALAAQMVIEPRLRLYPVATGVVKPYALLAFTLRVYDGFDVPNVEVKYPGTPGGASYGPTAGAGVMFDPIAPLSIFLEVPGTLLLTPAARVSSDPSLTQTPARLESDGWVVRFVGGLSVRL